VIPEQLKDDEYLLKIHSPEADCNYPGKQPVGSAETGPFYTSSDPELVSHIQDGGNVGKALKGPLVVFDVDHEEFASELSRKLPPTFVVESGGSGFGQHWYYHCPEWAENRQFKVQGTDYGSLRTGNWQVVIPPSVHPESGNQYQVDSDSLISSVGIHEIENLISGISGIRTANTTGGGGKSGGGGSVGSSELPEIPSEYPQRDSEWRTMQSWLEANNLLGEFDRTADTDWSGTEFKIAKCLAEAGFSEKSISSVLDRLSHNSKWHSRGESYRTRTVRKAILSACNDEYVDFSNTVDMGASKASERRKTESGSEGTGSKRGENNMPEFTEKESTQVKEGSSDGDRAVEAVRVEGQDGSDTFEFVSIRKGRVQTVELTNGEEGQMIDVDETNGKSVGGTADLDLVIEALQELQEEIN
jgi:hypothetical protein